MTNQNSKISPFGLMSHRDSKILIFAFLFLIFSFSGCALFLVGAGVGGGIAISRDTIEGHFDKGLDQVWKASREVLMQEGFIRLEDRAHGQIEGEVKKSDVKIEAFQVSGKTVRLRVKARKSYKLVPNIDLANELYNKIFHKLE